MNPSNSAEFIERVRRAFPEIPKYVSKLTIDFNSYDSYSSYPTITVEFYPKSEKEV